MDNRKENIMPVEKMRQRSRELSKHLPKSPATEIKQLTKSLMNAVGRIQELKEEREQLGDRSKSSKKYIELTAGIKNNEQRAQDLLDKIDKLSPKQVDKLVERYTDSAEPIYETIPGDTKSSEKDVPLPEIRDRTKKEVAKAVVEANRKFNERHKGISKDPYANRQPKVTFDGKAMANGMNREDGPKKKSQKLDEHIYETIPEDTKSSTNRVESSQKRDHREKETGKASHKLQTESLQKKSLPETQKLTLKDRINNAHHQKENNHLKHGSPSRNNRPQTSPNHGR
ncbi:hypothetical protein [Enterococcus mundtii]|uniref:Uncharacterized protein n=1 Tax=Enterococcus mundtii TaxID=53346 RepID=A0A2S7RZH5_ENTMU|nr:hypothetical protein [Enterococcus mundtii]PQF25616.1 hypothetical protein CUS89_01150 [Enterococcus mundtii]